MKTHAMDASTLTDVTEAAPSPVTIDAEEDHPELPWRARGRLPLPVWLSIVVPSLSMVLALLLASAVDALPAAGSATRVAVSCDAPPPSATGGAIADSGCRRNAPAAVPAR